ncbi:MAG TPA: tRNA epoxyqueuosine(34) reductase QueG [Gammaproteobacteria bacterium]|nr:tRNA epoxyqueuosine(34) reductase QueG [Gammaproteobacteria bacterium]
MLCTDELQELADKIKCWSHELGFQQTGISDTDLSASETRLLDWLDQGFHGEMDWMQRHGSLRTRPQELVPGTLRIISVRMDYLPAASRDPHKVLHDPALGYVSRYALGRDYHKMMRKRLQKLAQKIQAEIGPFGYRAFVDSAPVQEKALAQKAGLGWTGKHSNVVNSRAGSWFFLGELFTDLPLPLSAPADNHCGHCQACIEICPTRAIVAPYTVDARRCISYLTIEHAGAIPVELRAPMGNRIYGCDDCQLICPWNRFAQPSPEQDYSTRNDLDAPRLLSLFEWTEESFLTRTEGSPLRRMGHQRWLRNIAVALGNAPADAAIIRALEQKKETASELLREHLHWSLAQQQYKLKMPRQENLRVGIVP